MAARNRHFIVVVAVAGLLALGGLAYYANSVAPASSRPGAGAPAGGFAVAVETVKVAPASFQDEVSAVGSLKSNESVVLRPEIAGRIAAIQFQEGAPAAKGVVLVALDASTQNAELKQAEANLALAQANYRRTEDLFEKKFVSERAKDEAAVNLKVLEAALTLAQAKQQKTQIRAPFAGSVGIRNVSVGDYVKEGQELINIEDISALKVDFRLPESLFARLQKGQTIEVSTDAMPGRSFRGTVDAIDPLFDASGRAISLRARLPNPELKLRPGMFVRVRLAFGGERNGLAVPEEALMPSGSDNFVFKIVDGKAARAKVKIGQRRDARAEIVEGLKAGDEVVTAGHLKLRDGVSVAATPAVPAAAQTAKPAPQAPLPGGPAAKSGQAS